MRKSKTKEINKVYEKTPKVIAEPMEPKLFQECWILNQIIRVPHYKKRGVFMNPGGTESSPEELKELGGGRIIEKLWVRVYD